MQVYAAYTRDRVFSCSFGAHEGEGLARRQGVPAERGGDSGDTVLPQQSERGSATGGQRRGCPRRAALAGVCAQRHRADVVPASLDLPVAAPDLFPPGSIRLAGWPTRQGVRPLPRARARPRPPDRRACAPDPTALRAGRPAGPPAIVPASPSSGSPASGGARELTTAGAHPTGRPP